VLLATEARSRRFAEVEGSPLARGAEVREVRWPSSLPDRIYPDRYRNLRKRVWFGAEEDRYNEAFDRELAEADALITAPWSWACVPTFDEHRLALTRRLRVIAGTFDNRFHGMIDIAEATRRGVTVVDTSRSMTPTVARPEVADCSTATGMDLHQPDSTVGPPNWEVCAHPLLGDHFQYRGLHDAEAVHGVGRDHSEFAGPTSAPFHAGAHDDLAADDADDLLAMVRVHMSWIHCLDAAARHQQPSQALWRPGDQLEPTALRWGEGGEVGHPDRSKIHAGSVEGPL
jgi:hypothetical protein